MDTVVNDAAKIALTRFPVKKFLLLNVYFHYGCGLETDAFPQ
jgi:hypothetical protein